MGTSTTDSRLIAIDAARGAAMLLVCAAHFLLALTYADAEALEPGLMLTVTAVASPTFMVISGVTVGYLLTRSRLDPWRMRARLMDRAALLLVPVHLLVRLPHLLDPDQGWNAVRVIEITDAIALAILLNLWLIRIHYAKRLAVAVAIFGGAWLLNLTWNPDGALLTGIKDVLVRAAWDHDSVLHGFAVLPWTAVHLAATVLGERMAVLGRPVVSAGLIRGAATVGVTAMMAAVIAKLGHVSWRETLDIDPSSSLNAIVATLVSPFGKYPPSPAYVAFCGGAGLIFLSAVFTADRRGWLAAVASPIALLGRSSLCVWVVQAWVYWGIVQNVPVPAAHLLPLYFVSTFALIWVVAFVWDRHGWNRHLTLGIPWLVERMRSGDSLLRRSAPGRA